MRPRLHVHRVEHGRPATAARAALRPCLDRIPRARPVILVIVSYGAGPGLSVAPWTVDGCARALADAGWGHEDVSFALLGPPAASNDLRTRLVAHGIGPAPEGRALPLAMPGTGGWVRVPRAWIGRNLCLLAPMAHRGGSGPGGDGPLRSALGSLTHEWGRARAAEVGARVAGEAFAGAVAVADGTWWAELDDEDLPRWLVAVDRVAATHDVAVPDAASTIDRWIGGRLGLASGPGGLPRPATFGAGTDGWPRVPAIRSSAPEGLAGRALGALWRPTGATRRHAGAAALMPHVPGPLGRQWHRYQDAPVGSA